MLQIPLVNIYVDFSKFKDEDATFGCPEPNHFLQEGTKGVESDDVSGHDQRDTKMRLMPN